jgi:outer membrane protein assembly factor BamB
MALVCLGSVEAVGQSVAPVPSPVQKEKKKEKQKEKQKEKEAVRPLPTEVRWSVAVPARPAAPPAIGANQIYLALQSGVVVAYGITDGVEAWRVEIQADQPLAVEGDRVFVASGEAIHALAAKDGSVLWQAPAGTLTAPMLAQGGWLIASSAAGLAAFRSADGGRVWGRETGLQHGRATIEGDNLYAPLEDGRLLALDLRTGADRWVHNFGAPPKQAAGAPPPAVSEVLAYPDRLFVGAADRKFYCLNAADGSLVWRFPIGAVLRGQPVGDGTRVFITAMDNVVSAFDRRAGHLLWHASVPFRPTTGPVLLGTTLAVPGAASEVRGFDAAGHPVTPIKLEESLAIPPAFAESAGAAVMAAVTGSLNGQWKLLLVEESRALPVVPLTQLPGVNVPVVVPVPPA